MKQKTNQNKTTSIKNQFNQDDTYGVFKLEMEVDTDVNEDSNRESLLDDSVDAFLDTYKNGNKLE
ncbi:hypothetical protein ACLM5H_07405 [Fredinandcohnia humi]